jgi:carboxyl-terminal processing protease
MGKDEYDLELARRYSHGEFISSDSIKFPDSLKYYTLKKTRLVYGGGGIMPDLFIPLDTTNYSDYYRDLVRLGILNQFVLNYVDGERQGLLTRFSGIEEFKKDFEIDQDIIKRLVSYAAAQGLEENPSQLAISENQIRLLLKGYIARDLWSTSEFYEVINDDDPRFRTALSVIENWNLYEASLLTGKTQSVQ